MAKTKSREKEEADKRAPVARDGAYVMMLFITLVAIATGCVLLYLDNEEYGGKSPPKETAPAIQKLGDKFTGPELPAAPAAAPAAAPGGPAPAPGGPAPGPAPGAPPMPGMPMP
jgi:hypothetical protein